MSEIKKAEFGYAEKSALFNEVQKALKALNLRAKQYGVDEVYNWCKFVLGAKPGSFTEGQQIAAVFFMQTAHKFLDGLADVHKVAMGETDPYVMVHESEPKVTYRLDESYVQRLMLMRMIGGRDGLFTGEPHSGRQQRDWQKGVGFLPDAAGGDGGTA